MPGSRMQTHDPCRVGASSPARPTACELLFRDLSRSHRLSDAFCANGIGHARRRGCKRRLGRRSGLSVSTGAA